MYVYLQCVGIYIAACTMMMSSALKKMRAWSEKKL